MKKIILFGLICLIFGVNSGFSQKSTIKNIRKIDFRNFNFGETCGGSPLILRKGKSQYDYSELSAVKYVDINRDGKEDAVVFVDSSTSGSSGSFFDIFVFEYRGSSAKRIWHKCYERSSAKLVGRSILFTYPEYIGDDAHCCPSYITTDT